MKFPDSYFEDEVRDGFYVPGMMKRAWAAQLEILQDVDRVCKKYDIPYFADFGAMLGAVRHGGFIPWDDDLDIAMKRKDYERFIRIAQEEMTDWYDLLSIKHPDQSGSYVENFVLRLYNKNKVRTDKPFLDKFHGFPYVAGIDIFVLDCVAPTEEADAVQMEELRILATLASEEWDTLAQGEIEECLREVERIYRIELDRNSPQKQLLALADDVCRQYEREDSEYLANQTWRITGHDQCKYPRKCYEDVVMMPFETIELPVPVGYDEILTRLYGAYREPVHVKGGHAYPFFQKQQDECEQKNKTVFAKYEFSSSDLEAGEKAGGSLKAFTAEMSGLLGKACESAAAMLESGDTGAAAELLEDCQEGAIALGERIDEVKGDGFATVEYLEQLCEALYVLHEAILGHTETDVPQAQTALSKSLADVKESVQRDILAQKEAVFLPFKPSAWETMEPAWKALCEDTSYDVYVVPVPYCYKRADGSRGELRCETEGYPAYVPLTDYKAFDFALHHPDRIYIQSPYDGYNAATDMPPFFYSDSIKKYTEKLIYIPWFCVEEIDPEDWAAVHNMEYYCTMPGVVRADAVIAGSKELRQRYIDKLTEFAGEGTRKVWEKKILGGLSELSS